MSGAQSEMDDGHRRDQQGQLVFEGQAKNQGAGGQRGKGRQSWREGRRKRTGDGGVDVVIIIYFFAT